MRLRLLFVILAAFVGFSIFLASAEQEQRGTLRHVVSFKFKESASAEDIQKVEAAFRDLRSKIPQIVSYEAGTNVSPENLNKGFTHCFVLTFASTEDRDAYLVHPDHKAFADGLGPYLEDVFVIDFWAE